MASTIVTPDHDRSSAKSTSPLRPAASSEASVMLKPSGAGIRSLTSSRWTWVSVANAVFIYACRNLTAAAYTWFANFHSDPKHRSIVCWELTPTKSGTHVKMTHSGLATELQARQDYAGGWPGVLQEIKTFAKSESEDINDHNDRYA